MATEYKVNGMNCSGCVSSVRRAILAAIPEARVDVELASGVVSVDGCSDDARIARAVESAGFEYGGKVDVACLP